MLAVAPALPLATNWCRGSFADSHALRARLGAPAHGYQSCAVVGSSGVLALERLGKRIDDADFVMRFNMNRVQGFEQLVGNRTSLRSLNTEALSALLAERCTTLKKEDDMIRESHNASWCPSYPVFLNTRLEFYAEAFATACSGATHVFNASVLGEHDEVLQLMSPNETQTNFMSGQLGVALATMLCPNGVDVYGFTHNRSLPVIKKHDMPYHYYDTSGSARVDSLDESALLLSELAASQPDCIRLWTPDARRLSPAWRPSMRFVSPAPGSHGDPFIDDFAGTEEVWAEQKPGQFAEAICGCGVAMAELQGCQRKKLKPWQRGLIIGFVVVALVASAVGLVVTRRARAKGNAHPGEQSTLLAK